MRVIVGVDGSKYGQWAIEWATQLLWVRAPTILAVHVVDVTTVYAPFIAE